MRHFGKEDSNGKFSDVPDPLQASDAISTGSLLEVMVEVLAEGGQWEQLNKHLEMMTKKRNQLKQVWL